MFNLGPLELIVIFVVALLVFGPNKLPEIGRQVGRAIREFRQFQNSFQTELRDVLEDPPPGPLVPEAAPASAAPAAESAPAGEAAEAQPAPEAPTPASPDEVGATPAEGTGGEGGGPERAAPDTGPG